MGAPSITISFIEKAMTAVTRGEHGIVMLWVKDTLAAPAVNPVTVVTEKDIPDSLKDATVEQIKLAMISDFSVSMENDVLTVSFVVNTIYGDIEFKDQQIAKPTAA